MSRRRSIVFMAAGFVVASLPFHAGAAEAADTAFFYTGVEQGFAVPAGVTQLRVTAVGAPGRSGPGLGGRGAQVQGTVVVSPGQTLYVAVGGAGAAGNTTAFNGGGSGGGGGASDVRVVPRAAGDAPSLQARVIVAAGGGGAGSLVATPGRDADTPAAATCTGGTATASAGGDAGDGSGVDGQAGVPGTGGAGGNTGAGGGGGGGLFGGGGGGFQAGGMSGCGGGGGSSLVPPGGSGGIVSATTPASVRIEWTPPSPVPATPPDAAAPALTRLSLVGHRLSYLLSEAAVTTFRVQRARPGHRVGGRCVTRRARGPRCVGWVTLPGAIRHTGLAGANVVRFAGRIGGRVLPPGGYRIRAVSTDAAGNRSGAVLRAFRIPVPGHRAASD